jgi:hypothetical protein
MPFKPCADFRFLPALAVTINLAVYILQPGSIAASPCQPNDPNGDNPGNLCLPFPTHGMSINSNSFRQGFATDGFYGTALGPNQPGAKIVPTHQSRTPIESYLSKPGYWTRIEATNGRTTVQTNTGNQWNLQVK